jgi:hypothetical protein
MKRVLRACFTFFDCYNVSECVDGSSVKRASDAILAAATNYPSSTKRGGTPLQPIEHYLPFRKIRRKVNVAT